MKSDRLSFFTSRVGLSEKADSTIIDSRGKQLIQIIAQQSLWIMHIDFVISVHPNVISTGYFTDSIQSCSWMSRSSSAWGLIMIDKWRIISLLKSFTRVDATSAETHKHMRGLDIFSVEIRDSPEASYTRAAGTQEIKSVWICHTATDFSSVHCQIIIHPYWTF